MKKLDFNFNLKNLDGTEIQAAKANRILAEFIAGQTKGDPIKLYYWGLELYKSGVLELDKSDILSLKTMLSDTETLTVLAKGQLLEEFIKHI
jgi:hypothetical protein